MVLPVFRYRLHCPCPTDLCTPLQRNQGAYMWYSHSKPCSRQKGAITYMQSQECIVGLIKVLTA